MYKTRLLFIGPGFDAVCNSGTIAVTMDIWSMGISFALLVALIILLRYEEKVGRRLLLSRFRSWLDRLILKLHHFLTHLSIRVGTGSIRLMVHFFIHKVISSTMWLLQWFEGNLYRLQKRNRKVAKSLEDEQVKTHLHLIAEHKETSALSEEAKQELKNKAME